MRFVEFCARLCKIGCFMTLCCKTEHKTQKKTISKEESSKEISHSVQVVSPMTARIEFGKDEATISPLEMRKIKQIATLAAKESYRGKPMKLLLRGYSGNTDRPANVAMSYKRALEVARAITKFNPEVVCILKPDTYCEAMMVQREEPVRKKLLRCVQISQFYEQPANLTDHCPFQVIGEQDVSEAMLTLKSEELDSEAINTAPNSYDEILVKER